MGGAYFVKVGSFPTLYLDYVPFETLVQFQGRALTRLGLSPDLVSLFWCMCSTKPLVGDLPMHCYQLSREATIRMIVRAH